MLDTHPCFSSPFVLYTRLLQSDAGVQEQEIPDGNHRNVKIPDDQDQE